MSDIVVSAVDSVVSTPPPSSSPSTANTTADYLELAKQYLYTGSHDIRDKLSGVVSAGDTAITLQYGNVALQPGIRLSCELEDMHVWTVSADGKQATAVERGQYGTVAATHTAGKMLYLSPKFSDAEILREINNEIRDLWNAGIFRVGTRELSTQTVSSLYIITGWDETYQVLEVRARDIGPSDHWYVVQDWELKRNVSVLGSSITLSVNEPLPVPSIIRIDYSYPFTTLTALTDVVATVTGLPTTALDIPLLGAAIRLTAGREIRRNFDEWQGETRRASEVPPGANNAASRNLMLLYNRRVIAESNRLQARYPKRKVRRAL